VHRSNVASIQSNRAINAYTNAILSTPVYPYLPDVQATLLSNRSAAFLKVGFYQFARHDAEQVLKLEPNHPKARFRLASALFHLGSYRNALDIFHTMQSPNNKEIQESIRQVIVYDEENRTGDYDIATIDMEERQNPRLSHANDCSGAIELRTSRNGGPGGRGMFSKAVIPQGTLLVASKAIVGGFEDELKSPEIRRILSIVSSLGQVPSKVGLVNDLYALLGHGSARTILDLEGGVNGGLNIDLRRDDVYDLREEEPKVTLPLRGFGSPQRFCR
jgi:tetratricopeptide (TPR) repeat protein